MLLAPGQRLVGQLGTGDVAAPATQPVVMCRASRTGLTSSSSQIGAAPRAAVRQEVLQHRQPRVERALDPVERGAVGVGAGERLQRPAQHVRAREPDPPLERRVHPADPPRAGRGGRVQHQHHVARQRSASPSSDDWRLRPLAA